MITLKDLVARGGLREEQILAIAASEHVLPPTAYDLAAYLAEADGDADAAYDRIVADIRGAQARDDTARLQELLYVLHHMLRSHPQSRPEIHPWVSAF